MASAEEARPATAAQVTAAASPPSATQVPASPAIAAPAAPRLLTKKFDDWTWRCVAPADGKSPASCETALTVRVNQDGKTIEILNLAVSKADDKAGKVSHALVALTPFDVHLPSQFGLTISDSRAAEKDRPKPIVAPYRNCNQQGCFVVTPLDATTIARLRAAQEGAGFFRLIDGKTVKVVFSLKGFDKAIDALGSKELPPPAAVAAVKTPAAHTSPPPK